MMNEILASKQASKQAIQSYEHLDLFNREHTDVLRGLSMLLVISGHVGVGVIHSLVALGGIGVSIFLIISGYGLHQSFLKNGLNNFCSKRLLRVLLPYIVWIILYHIVVFFSPISPNNTALIPRYWFVEYIIGWYIVFYLAYRYFQKFAVQIMLCLSVLSFFLCPKLQAEQAFCFVIGVLCSVNKDFWHKYSLRKQLIFGFVCLLVGCLFAFCRYIVDSANVDLLQKAIPLCMKFSFGVGLILLCRYRCRLLSLISVVAYELYLVHYPFFGQIDSNWLNLFIFIIQSAFLAYLLHIIVAHLNQIVKRYVSSSD